MDAILTKQYQGAPVAVKLQKESETAAEAAALLQAAGKKKNCRMTVLILRKADDPDTHITDTQRPPSYCLTATETKKARD